MRLVLLLLNGAGVSTSAAFAVRGLLRPSFVRPEEAVGPLGQFWSASSAVRSFGLAVPLVVALARPGRDASPLLVAAGLVQLGDSGLGVWQRKADMALAPAVLGLVHLVSARLLSR